jgi:CelD/BcsL family acetyltransferase involved in cellulose biosynthesis
VAVFEGADAIEHAASAWKAIEDAGGVNSPFQSLAVARAAVPAHLANGEMPRIVTVRDGHRPMAIYPTVVGHWLGIPSIRFLGEPFVQYGDVIARPEANAAHLEAALAAAADERIASVAFFRRVRIDAAIAPILVRRAAVVTDDGAPIVDLRDGARLKSHHARELRRLRRRLSEQGDVVFEVLSGAATREILHETLQFKRAWLIERGLPSTLFGNPHWERVILDLAGARCGATEMMVARVVVGGTTAATEIGFVDRDTWFAYMGALAPDVARFGPGHILMDELMAWCRARGLKAYDLLPPIQPYKLALTSRTIPVRDYALALGLAGFPAILAARVVPIGKRVAAAAPLSWRRWIVRRHLRATT